MITLHFNFSWDLNYKGMLRHGRQQTWKTDSSEGKALLCLKAKLDQLQTNNEMLNQLTRTKDVFEVRQQHQIIKIKRAFYYRNLYWAFRIFLLLIYGLSKIPGTWDFCPELAPLKF